VCEVRLCWFVSACVWERPRVDAIYERNHELVERRLNPLGLVLKAGIWYLVADSDGQYRTFRVARFRQASVSDERFECPADFELPAYWTESTAAYEENAERLEVTL